MMLKNTFGERVIDFNNHLKYLGEVPPGFKVINPFIGATEAVSAMAEFYRKYYNDNGKRRFIMGINPGRHGAAMTGVPFTDTKRLASVCGIRMENVHSHEISSVFIYDVIAAYGGVEIFYKDFYINSPFPLAIIREKGGKWTNANYYDDRELMEMSREFMVRSIKQHIELGLDTSEVFVLGKKNSEIISRLNNTEHLFGSIITLDHPRFIQQYKSKERDNYILEYVSQLKRNR